MSETVLRRRVAWQKVTTRRRLERQIAKAQTSFRHKEKREARRFSRTAQKPFFSLLPTTLQALGGACGRKWKSPLIIPLIAGYPGGIAATLGPARYTAGTEFYLRSRDVYATQKLLGHEDVSTTVEAYVKPSEADLERVMSEVFDGADS
jgi:hypothetical protein